MKSSETDLKIFRSRADQRWISLRRQLGYAVFAYRDCDPGILTADWMGPLKIFFTEKFEHVVVMRVEKETNTTVILSNYPIRAPNKEIQNWTSKTKFPSTIGQRSLQIQDMAAKKNSRLFNESEVEKVDKKLIFLFRYFPS